MGYIKAKDILPEDLLDAVQAYVDGEYLYIPRKECNRKAWGELKRSGGYVAARNAEIGREFRAGATARELAARYYLSIQAIHKIVAATKPK